MDYVRWDDRPKLRRPVLVAAFEGWNDAADAATSAARFLRDHWAARQFAEIDPETFYDFSATRPQVRLVDGLTREIVWPANELFGDRKSTRLNSSHRTISYAVFCLKKK